MSTTIHHEIRLLALLLMGALAIAACDRREATREELKRQDKEWSSRLAALRRRHTEIAARLAQIPAAPTEEETASAKARRLHFEASVEGQELGLSDLETRRRDNVQRIEAALEHGRDDGERVLGETRSRMADYFAQQDQQMSSTEAMLARTGDAQ